MRINRSHRILQRLAGANVVTKRLAFATLVLVLIPAMALAGTGVGAVFNLGKTNKVNAQSTLTGSAAKMLQVTNTSGSVTTEAQYLTRNRSPTKITSAGRSSANSTAILSVFGRSASPTRNNTDPSKAQNTATSPNRGIGISPHGQYSRRTTIKKLTFGHTSSDRASGAC